MVISSSRSSLAGPITVIDSDATHANVGMEGSVID